MKAEFGLPRLRKVSFEGALKTGEKCKFGQKLTTLATSSFSGPLCSLHFVALVEFIDLVEFHRTASDSDKIPDVSEF